MLYNDETTKTGICQEMDDICGSNSISYPLSAKNRRLNSALDAYFLIAMAECGGWSVEDSNLTTFAIAKANLVSGQQDYAFPSELLILEGVDILSPDGSTWVEILPIDKLPLNQSNQTPISYRKNGNSIFLSPAPNYNMTLGVRLRYRRAFSYSTLSGTTFSPTSPGIPSIFHTWLARKSSLPYLINKDIKSKNDIQALISMDEAQIIRYFGERPRDQVRGLRVSKKESNR